ncbi:MAG: peptidase [Deltaproteobacteria bacterium RBG_13_65_10]|nr:MAG: peptidase [Deltaproteobacteria bacterium RBG_13_65_10]
MSAERLDLRDVAVRVLEAAKKQGASGADAIVREEHSLSAGVHLGTIDKLKTARERSLGLRVFYGHRSAMTSTSDFSTASLDRLVMDTCALARVTAEDPTSGLPDPSELGAQPGDFDLYDPEQARLSVEDQVERVRRAEAAAMAVDKRITNSEGAEWDGGAARTVLANTHGFLGEVERTGFSLYVAPIAQENGAMQRDYYYTAGCKLSQLESPEEVGRKAGERALRRLSARKVATCRVPVIFDADNASSLLDHLAGAVSGTSLYRGASFLIGKLGERIGPERIMVVDDGTLPARLGSAPFDGEGLPTRRTIVVDRGRLASWILDTYSARKLDLQSTGNARRGISDAPTVAPHNFYLEPGKDTPEDLIRSVKRGLYVTELIGFGVNTVTGDYSRGAAGLWIENGELAYPVEEITVAGNLLEMFRRVEGIANDLDFRRSVTSPTILIGEMTVAGD